MDNIKKQFLLDLMDEGDNGYVHQYKNGNWKFGYVNDYPLQHGKGEDFNIDDKVLDLIISKYTMI